MRRIIIAIMCCLILTGTVLAASEITSLENYATISSDGSCQVSLALTIHLDEAVDTLYYPLPGEASQVTLNGASVRARRRGDIRQVDLSGVVGNRPGDYSFNIHYTLSDVILRDEDGNLTLEVPLLSGFQYPIASMEFGITLPGEVPVRPTFSSGYFQESIESNLTFTTTGATISGVSTQTLKDHESLVMTLPVTEDMFPQPVAKRWSTGFDDVAMVVCAILAILYWAMTLRCLPPRFIQRTTGPDGTTPGTVGTWLTMQGADLTMLVVGWAQMGYLLIHVDDNGRILLHKRMEMGNERPGWECKLFRTLFGKKRMVDGTGYHYAQLCRKTARQTPGLATLFTAQSGNPLIFRGLLALGGGFGGMALALGFHGGVFVTFWVILLFLLGMAVAWLIQAGCTVLHLRNKFKLWLALGAMGLWLILGAFAGEFSVSLTVALTQFLGGLAAAYGGRRSEMGKAAMSQILGLGRFMRHVSHGELLRISRMNPTYFYDMAPYALALGVEKSFARRIGGGKLPECPWLTTGLDGHMTPQEWMQLLRDAVAALDARQKKLPLERFINR